MTVTREWVGGAGKNKEKSGKLSWRKWSILLKWTSNRNHMQVSVCYSELNPCYPTDSKTGNAHSCTHTAPSPAESSRSLEDRQGAPRPESPIRAPGTAPGYALAPAKHNPDRDPSETGPSAARSRCPRVRTFSWTTRPGGMDSAWHERSLQARGPGW